MNANSLDILVPISFVLGITLMILVTQYLSYLNRKQALSVIREAVAQNHQIDADTIISIAHKKPRRNADLRRGCLLLSLAAALVSFSFIVPDQNMRAVLRGLVFFPFFTGATYLFFHKRASGDGQV